MNRVAPELTDLHHIKLCYSKDTYYYYMEKDGGNFDGARHIAGSFFRLR